MAESITTISDLDHDALVHVFSQLLDDPAGLALASRCACVSLAWRKAAYDPLLYVRLTNWAKVAPEEGEPPEEEEEEAEEVAVTHRILRRLVRRSQGSCKAVVIPQKCFDTLILSGIVGALDSLRGNLESLVISDLHIQADGSSLEDFESLGQIRLHELVYSHSLMLAAEHGEDPYTALRRLIRDKPAKALRILNKNQTLFNAIKDATEEEDVDDIVHRVLVEDLHEALAALLKT